MGPEYNDHINETITLIVIRTVPARVPGRVEVGEVEDGAVGLPAPVQGPLSGGQHGGEVAGSELAGIDGKLKSF